MIREVNLISHLPLYIQGYREIQGIMNAEEPELQMMEDDSEKIKDNMFVLYTDEVGIERYEKMLGLTPLKNDSLSNRQANVLAQYTNTVIYTMRGLTERMNVICGVDNYTMELNGYHIKVKLIAEFKHLTNAIKSMMKDMIPANMMCEIEIVHTTHEQLSIYTHEYIYDYRLQ